MIRTATKGTVKGNKIEDRYTVSGKVVRLEIPLRKRNEANAELVDTIDVRAEFDFADCDEEEILLLASQTFKVRYTPTFWDDAITNTNDAGVLRYETAINVHEELERMASGSANREKLAEKLIAAENRGAANAIAMLVKLGKLTEAEAVALLK